MLTNTWGVDPGWNSNFEVPTDFSTVTIHIGNATYTMTRADALLFGTAIQEVVGTKVVLASRSEATTTRTRTTKLWSKRSATARKWRSGSRRL